MTTRISSESPVTTMVQGPATRRQTAQPDRPFQRLVGAGANAVLQGAEAAATRLPGGPVLAAALHGGGPSATLAGPASFASGAVGVDSAGVGASGLGAEGALGSASEPSSMSSSPSLGLGAEGDRTLYYLELQQKISAESQTYSALSNVLKARHDTIKNAIGNIR